MPSLRSLIQAGGLHAGLLRRLRIFGVITVVLLAFVLYDIAQGVVDWRWALLLGGLGFLLGMFLFSRMYTIVWNEEAETISAGKMDTLGFVVLGIYILFEIGLHTELPRLFPAAVTVTPLLLATIAGSILGRLIGMIVEILRTHRRHR